MPLILASSSDIRRQMLRAAGADFKVAPPALDEAPIKRAHAGDPQSLAQRLAEAKALSLDAGPDDWVIGSDSVASVDGQLYSKPRDREEAAAHLRAFSGRTMILASAAALAKGGRVDWSHAESARLAVRDLSDPFIAHYLDAEWPAVGHCAGVFRMEGRGATLFDTVEGSHFTILGMPLLPLLGALRQRRLMPS